jgi:hypothetical protein
MTWLRENGRRQVLTPPMPDMQVTRLWLSTSGGDTYDVSGQRLWESA